MPLKLAADFFSSTVAPTVHEFLKETGNIRRGRLAAIVLYHMAEYWILANHPGTRNVSRELGALHKALIVECHAFQAIRDVADASKHALLSVQASVLKVADPIDKTAPPPADAAATTEGSTVTLTMDDGQTMPLEQPVRAVLAMWEAQLKSKLP